MTAETLSHWLDGARGRANPEQFRFLQLVVDRVAAEYDLPNPGRPALSEPLRYLLHGGPGTGKSHALTLLKDLFDELGLKQGIDWDILAYQNANAADLGGQTIHAAFGFSIAGPSADRPVSPEAAKRLAHYRWLFVDEISMVPANILGAMDQRLREVKADVDRFKLDSAGSPRPFGGVNVLASGDFTQLPPVSGGYLAEVPAHHARAPGEVPAQGRAAPPPLQELGRALLWDEFQGVVELKERERCKDAWWNEVTDQLRAGKLSEDNYKYLHGKEVEGCELAEEERASRRRVVQGPEDPRLREARFQEAPAVVATNDAKYQINKDRAKKFARDADGELFWSIARDVASSEVLKAEPCGRERKIRLLGETRGLIPVARWLQYHDKDTGGLLGTLPLAVGMRVALTQHLSDKALLAGEIGVVHSLVWQENRPRPDVVYVKFERQGVAAGRHRRARPLPGGPEGRGLVSRSQQGGQAQASAQGAPHAAAADPCLRHDRPLQPRKDPASGPGGPLRGQARQPELRRGDHHPRALEGRTSSSCAPFPFGCTSAAGTRAQSSCYSSSAGRPSTGRPTETSAGPAPCASDAATQRPWTTSARSSGTAPAPTSLPCACPARTPMAAGRSGRWARTSSGCRALPARRPRSSMPFLGRSWSSRTPRPSADACAACRPPWRSCRAAAAAPPLPWTPSSRSCSPCQRARPSAKPAKPRCGPGPGQSRATGSLAGRAA